MYPANGRRISGRRFSPSVKLEQKKPDALAGYNKWRRRRKKTLRSQPPPPEVLCSLHTNPNIFETAYFFTHLWSVFTGLLYHSGEWFWIDTVPLSGFADFCMFKNRKLPLTWWPFLFPPPSSSQPIKRYRIYLICIFYCLSRQAYIEQMTSRLTYFHQNHWTFFNFAAAPRPQRH